MTFTTGSRIGVRLRYKNQTATFDEPEEYPLKNKSHSLHSYSAELTYLHNLNLQSFLRYRLQDRIIFNIDELGTLKLTETPSHEYGYGFSWQTKNDPGWKIGLSAWATLVSMSNVKRERLFPDLGTEVTGQLTAGLLTSVGVGYYAKLQYSSANIKAGPYRYEIREGVAALALVWIF